MHVPTATDIRLAKRDGPFVPGNWRIEWINVPAEITVPRETWRTFSKPSLSADTS